MRTPLPLFRVTARMGVLALVAGLVVTVAPTAERAAAAGPVLEFSYDQAPDGLETYPYEDPRAKTTVRGRNTGAEEVKSFTVTLDATGLKDIADVSLEDPGCRQKEGRVFVCDGAKLAGGPLKPGKTFDVNGLKALSAKGAAVGASGALHVRGEAGGVTLGEMDLKVTVQDAGLVIDRQTTSGGDKVKPGSLVRPSVGLTHDGAKELRGIHVAMWNTPGLSFAQEFSNCEYGLWDEEPAARCFVEVPVEPGRSYDLGLSALKVGGAALAEEWQVSIGQRAKDLDFLSLTSAHRGTGPELKLTPRTDPNAPATPQFGPAEGHVSADNTMDLQAVGAVVDGTGKKTVTAEVGLRNNGPAGSKSWLGSEPGEDPVAETEVLIPPGTTAVQVPESCRGQGTAATGRGKPRVPHYLCFQDRDDYRLSPGDYIPFAFKLRIDEPRALAPGKVTVTRPDSDPDGTNNTAALTVTVDGKPGGGTGTAPGGSGSPSPSASTGGSGTSTGPDSQGAHPADGSTGGSMADTGAGPLPWIAAAAAGALAIGATLFATLRRRARS
ncbi:hypothetical protein ACIBK8_23490 [Streptomyces sp. NPDC050161]|uniref:hypothetical protein n=1 Tax=Streptomyces sp. NPDC050161 TaxID=3365604 RepID=UPI00378790DC